MGVSFIPSISWGRLCRGKPHRLAPGSLSSNLGDLWWAHSPGGGKRPGEGWVARPGSKEAAAASDSAPTCW